MREARLKHFDVVSLAVVLALLGACGRGPLDTRSRANDAAPVGGLEAALIGWWWLGEDIGNCTQVTSYFRFLPAGAAEAITIDENACYPEVRGTFILPASYEIVGTTLVLTQTDRRQYRSREQYDVAVGTLNARRHLFLRTFRPVDAVAWHATWTADHYDDAGVLQAHHAVTAALRFSEPLPASGEGSCIADVSFAVDDYTGRYPATPCRYGPAGGIQQIEFLGIDFGDLPFAVSSRLFPIFGRWMRLNPADPTYLYQGAWPAMDTPPPGF